MSNEYAYAYPEFYSTYKLYCKYIGAVPGQGFSYSRWMRLPDQYKAAALYVNFFNEVTLAWYKVKTNWSVEAEGVEIVNQYLIKNVDKIKNDKKRFSPRYIYRVCYNCLYCLCIDPSKNKDRYYSETSESFDYSDDELNWFDFIGCEDSIEANNDKESLRLFFDSLPEKYQICIGILLDELTDTQAYRALKKIEPEIKNIRKAQAIESLKDSFEDFLKAHSDEIEELMY